MNRSLHKSLCVVLVSLLAAIAMQSCKPSLPGEIIPQGEMEDILYDYHLAMAMARSDYGNPDADANVVTYRRAVLEKYGVSQADFDSSMVYYMRHAALLHDIYAKIGDRMDREAVSLGASASDAGRYGDISSSGDTANVWKEATAMLLMPKKPFNYFPFKVEVDSAFHKGDKLMLEMNAQFLYQDGMRDGMAVMAVRFNNDSVVSRTCRIQSSQHYTMEISDGDSLGIKKVTGYFMLNQGSDISGNTSSTTLKLMFLQGIRLIRMHASRAAVPGGVKPAVRDSLRVDSARPAGIEPKMKLKPMMGAPLQTR